MQTPGIIPPHVQRGALKSTGTESDRTVEGGDQAPRDARLKHIPELDGLRGVAALMVFFHHACFSTVKDGAWPPVIQFVRHIALYGSNGVELFFVLSGFLITSILLGDRTKPTYYAPFYWKRVLRIVPVYVVMLAYIALFIPHSRIAFVCAVLFVANLSWAFHAVPLMPFWTLAIEEQFYLLWPTVVHRLRLQTLAACAVAIALGSIGFRLLFACFGHYNYFFTIHRCDGLAWGALLACYFVKQRTGERGGLQVVATALLAAAGVFLLNYLLPMTSLPWIACNAALAMTGISLLSMGVVGLLVFKSGAPWLRIFRSRILVFVGLISYAFYMVHLYVILAYDRHWSLPVAPQAHAYTVRVLVTLAIAIAIATLSRYLLELPAIRLRRFVPSLRRSGAQ